MVREFASVEPASTLLDFGCYDGVPDAMRQIALFRVDIFVNEAHLGGTFRLPPTKTRKIAKCFQNVGSVPKSRLRFYSTLPFYSDNSI